MQFKNLYFFAFTRPFTTTQAELELALSECAFTPCASTEQSHYGFVPALGKGSESLAHEAAGNILICARKEDKILPGQVVKAEVELLVDYLFETEQRKPKKAELQAFKEDVILSLLPNAFSRFTDTRAYINAKDNLIVIDASSRGKAEDILALLRKALGTLPVTSFTPDKAPDKAPDEVMTDWLIENMNGYQAFLINRSTKTNRFSFGMEAEFLSVGDDAAAAKVKNQDLKGEEVRSHIDAEKLVKKLALEYDESMSFVLCDDLSIKRLKFTDVLMEQNDDIDRGDHLARLDADFTLVAGEINRMLIDLLAEFGMKTDEYLEK